MHVLRHLPFSGLELPTPPKVSRKLIIVKCPVKSFSLEHPPAGENCVHKTDFQYPRKGENCPPEKSPPAREHCPPDVDSKSPPASEHCPPKTDNRPTSSRPVSSVKLYCCSTCMRGFCEEFEWKAHMAEHSGAKSLICKVCSNGYIDETAYRKHVRRHSPRKPFACNICGKSYSQSKMLTAHRRQHPKAKPFRCCVCYKGFLSHELLELHLHEHTMGSFLCGICKRWLVREEHLATHRCEYSGERPKVCGFCDKVYFCLTSYNSHLRSHIDRDMSLVTSNRLPCDA